MARGEMTLPNSSDPMPAARWPNWIVVGARPVPSHVGVRTVIDVDIFTGFPTMRRVSGPERTLVPQPTGYALLGAGRKHGNHLGWHRTASTSLGFPSAIPIAPYSERNAGGGAGSPRGRHRHHHDSCGQEWPDAPRGGGVQSQRAWPERRRGNPLPQPSTPQRLAMRFGDSDALHVLPDRPSCSCGEGA